MKISAFTTCLLISATFFAPGRTGKAKSTSHTKAAGKSTAKGPDGTVSAKAHAETHSTTLTLCTGGDKCKGTKCCKNEEQITFDPEGNCRCQKTVDDASDTTWCKNTVWCKTERTEENCCDEGFQFTDDSTTPETCKCQRTSHVETGQATPGDMPSTGPATETAQGSSCLKGEDCDGNDHYSSAGGVKYCCKDTEKSAHVKNNECTCK